MRSPNPGEEEEEKKKKKEGRHWDHQTQGKKKKKEDWSKVAAELWLVGLPCVFNYKNVIELWVMETENS